MVCCGNWRQGLVCSRASAKSGLGNFTTRGIYGPQHAGSGRGRSTGGISSNGLKTFWCDIASGDGLLHLRHSGMRLLCHASAGSDRRRRCCGSSRRRLCRCRNCRRCRRRLALQDLLLQLQLRSCAPGGVASRWREPSTRRSEGQRCLGNGQSGAAECNNGGGELLSDAASKNGLTRQHLGSPGRLPRLFTSPCSRPPTRAPATAQPVAPAPAAMAMPSRACARASDTAPREAGLPRAFGGAA
mmetsp:Transcript_101457/g.326053  ORF Transcript_101457/g.326053 Transcript_101457/m.326053 type:complete len:243 (-) Transcript_101457:18-746(-)